MDPLPPWWKNIDFYNLEVNCFGIYRFINTLRSPNLLGAMDVRIVFVFKNIVFHLIKWELLIKFDILFTGYPIRAKRE